MPKHVSQLRSDTVLLAQWLWSYFAQTGCLLYPNESIHSKLNTIENDEIENFCIQWPQTKIQLEIDGVKEGLDLVTQILDDLTESFEIEWSAEWNYLGNTQTRNKYITYLENFFWKNQSSDELKNHPRYNEMVATPWKVVSHADDLDFNISPATDFFDEKGVEIMESLMGILAQWDLNQSFICNIDGSFQAYITCSAIELFTSIQKIENHFVLIIETSSLTSVI